MPPPRENAYITWLFIPESDQIKNLKATIDGYKASRGFSATAELLVSPNPVVPEDKQ